MKIAYTPREATAVASVGETVIRAAVESGALPSHRNGARIVILHDDLVAWIKADCPRRPGGAS